MIINGGRKQSSPGRGKLDMVGLGLQAREYIEERESGEIRTAVRSIQTAWVIIVNPHRTEVGVEYYLSFTLLLAYSLPTR